MPTLYKKNQQKISHEAMPRLLFVCECVSCKKIYFAVFIVLFNNVYIYIYTYHVYNQYNGFQVLIAQ